MPRVAAYIRRSTPGEDDKNYSLESQLKDITAWAEREGHDLVATFSDPGGRSDTLDRPALNQLFEASRRHEFDIVAVWRFDRFSRDEDEAVIATYMLKQQSVRVVSITQPIPEGPMGTMMMSMYNFGSALELSGIRERVERGKRERVASGKLPPISRPKYGYQFDGPKKERYIPHPDTAPVVVRIFNEYLAGETVRQIQAGLNASSTPTPTQILLRDGWSIGKVVVLGEWRSASIFNILRDTSYMGHMVGYRTKYVEVEVKHPLTGETRIVKRKVIRSELDDARVEYGPDVCPPLVTAEVFDAAQDRMKHNKEQASRNTKHPSDLLLRAGLARCGWCGHALTPHWSKADNQHRYVCAVKAKHPDDCPAPTKYSVQAAKLDSYAWGWFVEQMSDPRKISAAFDSYLADADKMKVQLGSLLEANREALAEAQNEEDEYVKAVGRAGSDAMRDRFIAQAEEAHARATRLKDEIAKLEHNLHLERRDEQLMRTLQTAAPKALRRLQTADMKDRREAFHYCRVEVTVWGRGHTPEYTADWLRNYVHAQLWKWTQYFISAQLRSAS